MDQRVYHVTILIYAVRETQSSGQWFSLGDTLPVQVPLSVDLKHIKKYSKQAPLFCFCKCFQVWQGTVA